MKINIEVCVDSLTSAKTAIDAGAARLETCGPLSVGGVTPSLGLVKLIDEYICSIQTKAVQRVMLRPREGDFYPSENDLAQIWMDARIISEQKLQSVEGFVIGITDKMGKCIDEPNTRILIEKIKSVMPNAKFTFHRAFDSFPKEETKSNIITLKKLGYDTVLTSGQALNVTQGMSNIKDMIPIGINNKIDIMCGGGVNSDNVGKIVQLFRSCEGGTPTEIWLHTSSSITRTSMYVNKSTIDPAFLNWKETDLTVIRQFIDTTSQESQK